MRLHHDQEHSFYTEGYSGSSQEEPSGSERQQAFHRQEYGSGEDTGQSLYGGQQQALPSSTPLVDTGLAVAAVLSYSLFWFSGLLFSLFAGQNRYVRFHALQSLLFFGGMNVLDIGLIITIGTSTKFHLVMLTVLAILFFLLLNFVAFIGWLVAIFHAARGTYYKLPFAGNVVARCINWNVDVK